MKLLILTGGRSPSPIPSEDGIFLPHQSVSPYTSTTPPPPLTIWLISFAVVIVILTYLHIGECGVIDHACVGGSVENLYAILKLVFVNSLFEEGLADCQAFGL